jgi:hypothetical protein
MKGKISIILIAFGLLIFVGVWAAGLSDKDGNKLTKKSNPNSNVDDNENGQMSMGAKMLMRGND